MTIEQIGNSLYTGLSGDNKYDILNPNTNAIFIERDTGVIFRFNAGWNIVNTSGSGGGGSGTGSINTASNVGALGEGWFKQINLDDLQFKKAKAGSNVVSLASSVDNVTIDIVQSNLNLGLMGGVVSESSLPIASETLKGIVELSKNDGTESTGIRVIQDNDPRLTNSRVPLTHTHVGTDVNSGLIPAAQIPSATTTVKGAVILSTDNEATAGEVVTATDTRLSNARTPLAHVHDGVDITTGTVNNARLTDASTSTKGIVQLATSVQNTAGLAVQASDTRLSDSRVPTLHATTHKTGGSDVIKLDELGAPTDITTLNVSSTAHGLTPKHPNDITQVLRGDGTYGQMAPFAASYLTLATNTVLTNERVLTAGTNTSFVDAGAGSTLTINVPDATTLVKGAVELATDGESAANVVVQGNDTRMSNARTPTAHVHDGVDITTGTVANARLTDASTSTKGISQLATSAQVTAGLVVQASDTRLSDSRSPLAHVHSGSDITTGTVVAARLPDASETAKGIVELATNVETTAGLVVQANDSRLSDSRTPLSHVHSGADITTGTIGVSVLPTASTSAKGISQLATSAQTTAGLVVQASDTRLSDPRTPTTHSHGNADITDLAYSKLTGVPSTFTPSAHNHSATEITSGTLAVARGGTGNSTITQHALIKGGASNTYSEITAGTDGKVLTMVSGTPAWATATGGGGTLTGVANVGTGDGTVYRDTTSGTINLKTIKAGTNVTVTNNADDVTISSVGAGGGSMTATSLGTGEGTVYKETSGSEFRFRSLNQGTNITISQDANEITIDAATVPDGSETVKGIVELSKSDGTESAGTRVIQDNDPRLTNSRTPTSHVHSGADITSGTVGIPYLPVASETAKGISELATSIETTAGLVIQANDTRLSDARTPTAHSHGDSTITDLAYSKLTGVPSTFSPSLHATTHKSGGTDVIKLDELGAPTDITTLNVSSTAHGLAPKHPNDITQVLRGDGTYGQMAPFSASYLTLATNTVLTNERVLTAGTNISLVDGGAGSTLTLNVPDASTSVKGAAQLGISSDTAANLVVQTNDTRLSNSRTPTAHASTHMSAGADPIRIDELKIGTDVTTINATTTEHGLLPKLGGGTVNYFRADGTWATPPGTGAPITAQYITLATDATLTVERVLTAGTNTSFTDGGAGSTLTVNVPDGSTSTKGAVQLGTSSDTTANLVVQTNDTRLTNSRTPTAHKDTHKVGGGDAFVKGDDLNASAKYLEDITDPASDSQRIWIEDTTANIKYWSDEVTPVKHVIERQANKGAASGYASLDSGTLVPVAQLPAGTTTTKGVVELATSGENAANVVVQGDDSRLSNARTPTAHNTTHMSAGSDPIRIDELKIGTDVTTLNSTATEHGLLKKLSNSATQYMDGTGNWSTPPSTGAPVTAQYLTLATDATLTVERVLTSGTNIAFVDGGAGSTLTVNVPDGTTGTKGALQLATSVQTTSGLAVQASDTRLSDSRIPTLHKDSHKAGGTDAFVKGDDLNASARYLEDITDMASDPQRIWIDDATNNVKYWSDEASPVKHTIASASNTITFTNKTWDADATGNSITNIENADIKAAAGIVYSKLNLSNSIVAGDITSDAVTTAKILNANVTLAKLASDSVDSSKIVNDSIVNADVNTAAAIATSKLADSANFILSTLDNAFGAHYHDITKMTAPANPGVNDIRLYVDTADTHLKIRNNAGTIVDLHSVGGGITASSVDTFTNKTIDADATGNVITNIENADIKAAAGIVTTKLADSTNFVLTTRTNTFGDFDNIYKDNRIRINNPADTFSYTVIAAAIAANRNVTLPLLTGDDTFVTESFAQTLTNKTLAAGSNTITGLVDANIGSHTSTKISITAKGQLNSAIVYNDQTNTFGDFDQILRDNRLRINNPADTFSYTIIAAAIAANRNVTLPLLTGNDTFVTEAFTQTLTNKTLTTPVISSISNSGTITVPTGTDQLVGRATTDTLTNKTINGLDLNVNPKTATYTAVATDDFIPCAPAANMTINLPQASTASGYIYRIQKTNSNAFTVTIDPYLSETINGATTLLITSQYQGYVVWCDGTSWYTTVGTSERVGTATGTANGSNTVFNIAHGLGSAPYRAHIQCSSHSNTFTYTTDTTNIVVTFGTAPSSSPSTATFHWSAVL